ncbi:MAG: hypothetical protein ACOYL9_04900 [Ilumatobacteraceae bacterium]
MEHMSELSAFRVSSPSWSTGPLVPDAGAVRGFWTRPAKLAQTWSASDSKASTTDLVDAIASALVDDSIPLTLVDCTQPLAAAYGAYDFESSNGAIGGYASILVIPGESVRLAVEEGGGSGSPSLVSIPSELARTPFDVCPS